MKKKLFTAIAVTLMAGFAHAAGWGQEAMASVALAGCAMGNMEVKGLVEGIQKALETFKETNDARLAKLEKGAATGDFEAKLANIQTDLTAALALKKELEHLESKTNLMGLMGRENGGNPDKAAYKAAFFSDFVRKGRDTAELKALEGKAWNITTPADGGYAVPEDIDRDIEKLQRDLSPMRQLATVKRVGTSDYKRLVNVNGIASGWVGETDPRTGTNTSKLAEVTPFMGELYANPQVTQQSLDDVFFDVDSEITTQLIEEFAIAEGSAFVSGDGVKKPKGVLAYPTAATGDSARAFGTLEHIATGVAGDFAATNKADIFYDVLGRVKAGYRAGSAWMMNKSVMFEVMKLKNGDGDYLWQARLTESGLGLYLAGYAVAEAEDMPAKAANALSIAFGNFKRGYTVVDRVGMRMLRDPYSNKPYVGFYTTKRVGGMVVNSEAIKLVKFAAA